MTSPEDDTALLVLCVDCTAMRSEAVPECFCGATAYDVEPPVEPPVERCPSSKMIEEA
jgi:hypothetical protein